MAKKKETGIVKQENNIPEKSLNSMLVEDSKSGVTGFEGVSAEDLAIPFVSILQALSPQVRGSTRVEGAQEGDFFNTVSGEYMRGDIKLIPCAFQKQYVEWKSRLSGGGGFVQAHKDESILEKCVRDDKNQMVLPNGNVVVATAYHYCLMTTGSKIEQVVVAMTSTQLKKSRKWNTIMTGLKIEDNGVVFTPPAYSHIYTAKTVMEGNDKGQWYGWDIGKPVLIGSESLYRTAKKFSVDISKGLIKVSQPPVDEPVLDSGAAESEVF